jgi:hypothetical protein
MLKQSFLIIAITLGFTTSALAHPFHLCSGEMEFNPKTKRWEVAMKMHPSDIETVIRKKTGKKIDVAAKEGSPELVDYLSQHFQLTAAEPAKAAAENRAEQKLEFIGAEIERGWLWVYFEIPAPEGKGAVTLTHSVLLDDVEKQSNTILVRNKGKRASLHFSSDKRKVGNELLAAE